MGFLWWHQPIIDDPWVIHISSARKLGMQQEEAGHRAARVDRDGLEVRHANNDDNCYVP